MIRLSDICVSYDGISVLDGCTLSVSSGERIALTAPSGSGKTTVLGVIAGLVKPQSGKCEISGTVSYVFQEPRLLPWRNAMENLNVVLSDDKTTAPQAFEMLERLGLADAAKKYPHELSGGMQQRLAIGRALCYGGGIFLFDEPLKGMDAALRSTVAGLINEKTQGKTVVLASHDSGEIASLAGIVYVFSGGKFERETSV